MVLLGLGLLIASVSFLYYKHAPAGWWTFLQRLNVQPGNNIQDGDRKRNGDGDENEKEKGGKEEASAPKITVAEERPKEKEFTAEKSPSSLSNSHISSPSQPISPPPSKAAIDRAAMPPPPPLFKKSTPIPKPQTKTTPQSPTTPRAHASQPSQFPAIPIFSLDATNSSSPSSDVELESEPEIPSFPAANTAQRASNTGPRVPPRLNPLPAFTSASRSPSSSTTTTLSAPSRGPLPNRSPVPNRNPSSLAAPSL
ncbi:hypothetical protein BOTCAL_0616g00060, partial [Botryotinia calthae]